MHLTISGGHSISQCRGEIIHKIQHHFKALKENKEVSMNQRVSNRDMLQTVVHSYAEAISKYFLSSKMIRVSGTSSNESNLVGYPIEENIEV